MKSDKNGTQTKSKLKKKLFLVSPKKMKKGIKSVIRSSRWRKWNATLKKQKSFAALKKQKSFGWKRKTVYIPFFSKKAYQEKRIKEKGGPNIISIQSTHNNTIYTAYSGKGKVDYCVSTGMCGFKNSRKSTNYASQAAAEKLAALVKNRYSRVSIKLNGAAPGKLSGVRALNRSGLKITSIHECTMLPHNGCRSPKRRRL